MIMRQVREWKDRGKEKRKEGEIKRRKKEANRKGPPKRRGRRISIIEQFGAIQASVPISLI